MRTPESEAREQIDKVLEKCTWKVQDTNSFNLQALRELILRYSLFVEPQQIFTVAECLLLVIDELKSTVEAILNRAERLRQLILGDAVSGELLRG